MSWQRFARVGTAGAALSLACACASRGASDGSIQPATDDAADGAPPSDAAADGAPPSGAAVDGAADTASPSDAASLAQDAIPACTTDTIFLVVSQAPDNGGTYVLEAFHPSTGQLTNLGALPHCSPSFPAINALAVDHSGRFYVDYEFATISPVDTTAGFACVMPGFNSGLQIDLQPLGIAFVGQPDGGETLYGSFLEGPPFQSVIGTIDTHSGAVTITSGDAGTTTGGLTGTGDGRVFVSWSSTIVEVDPTTGAVLQTLSLYPSLQHIGLNNLFWPQPQFPLAFWAGDFFVFPATGASDPVTGVSLSAVVRFHPSDNSSAVVEQLDGLVLGAAVSTCAPLH